MACNSNTVLENTIKSFLKILLWGHPIYFPIQSYEALSYSNSVYFSKDIKKKKNLFKQDNGEWGLGGNFNINSFCIFYVN